MAEVWSQWEGRIINGDYPLRRSLGASDHSAVFLTESSTEGFLNAAIKIVPASAAQSEVQLWHWKTAATFSHPHLIHLLDSGQCVIDGRQYLFVVMEYAEENLAQVLPVRALQPDEVRQLLVPTLDALAFLHGENWVQGQLKPGNFLVVNDQLKLATDTIRPVGVSRSGVAQATIYDPPEADAGEVSAAGDVWALGVTLVEALTQYPPTWRNGRTGPPSLPVNLPADFAQTIHRCLSLHPADRPTLAELQTQIKQPVAVAEPIAAEPVAAAPSMAAAAPIPSVLQPVQAEPTLRAPPRPEFNLGEESRRGLLVPAVVGLLVIVAAVWGGSRLFRGHAKTEKPAAVSSPAASNTSTESAPSTTGHTPKLPPSAATGSPASPSASTRSSASPPSVATRAGHARREHGPSAAPPAGSGGAAAVVHEEIPKVPLSARSTIQGHVKVGVRVTVDSSGRVVRDRLDNPGPSRYFNRLASEAARKWRFAAAEGPGSREWVLRFEFGRDGTTVHAVRSRS